LRDVAGRRRSFAVAVASAALFMATIPGAGMSASRPPHLERFLAALGQVESSGRYTARNAASGAYGKYQIMPASWKEWAKQYLGSSTARPTPANQELVAHQKATALYRWLDAWPTVAHWWLTGSSERDPKRWSAYSRAYVLRVMALMGSIGRGALAPTPKPANAAPKTSPTSWIDARDRRLGDASAAIAYGAGWRAAGHQAYSDDHVRYATGRGASASLTFRGTGIAWIGPVGPTRGTARVYVDGKPIATVNLRASTFQPRRILFARALSQGKHTLRIVVTSTGRPVAIDELIVGR
jgi:hypothetical protein